MNLRLPRYRIRIFERVEQALQQGLIKVWTLDGL